MLTMWTYGSVGSSSLGKIPQPPAQGDGDALDQVAPQLARGLLAGRDQGKLNAVLSGDQPMPATATWISKKPDRCGGDACVRETRIPVWVLVGYRRLGSSDADILQAYPSLTAADLEAAWEYAVANPAEIDSDILENEEGEEGFVE
jgi:uncharacterized protein (DUF433 family)